MFVCRLVLVGCRLVVSDRQGCGARLDLPQLPVDPSSVVAHQTVNSHPKFTPKFAPTSRAEAGRDGLEVVEAVEPRVAQLDLGVPVRALWGVER